jgi:acetylornithine deacetylase
VDGLVEEVVTFAREQLEPEMQAVDPAARIVFEPKSSWPGLETPAAFDVVGLAKTLAGRNEHSKVAFGTEAGLFAAAGIPTVVIGPGSIDQAHKADEYVAVAQLEACGTFLDRLTAHSCA